MEYQEQPLDVFNIELAQTRPTMFRIPYISQWLGEVPIDIAIVLVMALFIGIINWFWRGALWFPFVWFIIAKAIEWDYHAITKVQLWQKHTMATLDAEKWGGFSVTPFPTRSKIPQGMEMP